MRREKLGGWCMITGAVLGLVTMAFHPTGTDRPLLVLSVHAVGLSALPLTLYGGWVLTRYLSARGPLPELALTFYGMSTVAGLLAATASGLMAPALVARAAELGTESGLTAIGMTSYNHTLNQSFAKVLVATSSIAIALWSAQVVRTEAMRRAVGFLGCGIGVLTLMALFSGHLVMDVHGFGAVMLVQAIWLILVGVELRSVGVVGPGYEREEERRRP